jgi:hypothetical protein
MSGDRRLFLAHQTAIGVLVKAYKTSYLGRRALNLRKLTATTLFKTWIRISLIYVIKGKTQ